jgi:hypothetical protein
MEILIVFDRRDHPSKIPHPETYRLVVKPIIGTEHLSKVLTDGGSALNIIYVETFDALGIACSALRPSAAPIHGIMPGLTPVRLDKSFYPSCPRTPPTSAPNDCSSRW